MCCTGWAKRAAAFALLLSGISAGGEKFTSTGVVHHPNLARTAQVTTVQLTPNIDNTLYESAAGSLSDGQGTFIFAGRTGSGLRRRALIRFDVAGGVPAGATITSAQLTLNMSRTIVGPTQVNVHRVLASWGEGTSNAGGQEGSGAPATPGDATWIHRFFNTSFWTSVGGDFAVSPSASLTVEEIGSYTWTSSPAMVSDVQGWLDSPSANFGWMVIGSEGSFPTAKRFDSSENAAAVRPKLTIEFTEPQPGSCCSGIGSQSGAVCENGLTEAECDARPTGTFFREGRLCEDNECGGCPECTQNDTCNDGNACTTDICDVPDACCVNADNFNPTTHCCDPDTGILLPLDDENPCTGAGICDGQTGQVVYPPLPRDTPCDDGGRCTTNDRCNGAGACVGDPVVCNDGNACTANDRCNPANGQCTADPPPNCDDGNACTRNDRCDPATGGCAADSINGLSCSTDAECAPGACVSNRCQCPAGPGDIPTVSEWGLIGLGLVLLTLAKLHFRQAVSVKRAA